MRGKNTHQVSGDLSQAVRLEERVRIHGEDSTSGTQL